MMLPVNGGWDEVVTGVGATAHEPLRQRCRIMDGNYSRMNWGKHLCYIFNWAPWAPASGLTHRVQIKESTNPGQLSEKGVGFQCGNVTLTGETYGTSRGTVSLGTVGQVDGYNYECKQIAIHLDPDTPAVRFYVNDTLAGSITNSTHIPSGIGANPVYFVQSIARPGTGYDGGVTSDSCMPRSGRQSKPKGFTEITAVAIIKQEA